jgi:hypothetical protein
VKALLQRFIVRIVQGDGDDIAAGALWISKLEVCLATIRDLRLRRAGEGGEGEEVHGPPRYGFPIRSSAVNQDAYQPRRTMTRPSL